MRTRSLLALAQSCLIPLAAGAESSEVGELRARVTRLELELSELRVALERLEARLAEPAPARTGPLWADASRWQQLRRGMTRFQVMQLLGEPGKVSPYYGLERWEYPGVFGARVVFDASGRLGSWTRPRPALQR